MNNSKKIIFLDCGTNWGQGFEQIVNQFNLKLNDSDVYMFEPNPFCFDIIKNKFSNFNLFNQAVWNKNEKRTINMEYYPPSNSSIGGAANIIQENFVRPHWVSADNMSEWPPKHHAEVECIDFSNFVETRIGKNAHIVAKLDIEGAEFEVLEKMIQDDTLKYINHIIVEWHYHTRRDSDRIRPKQQYLEIFKKNGTMYTDWY